MTKNPNETHAAEIETLKQFYAALNRNDVSAAVALLDQQIERVEFEDSPTGGKFRGLAELRDHIAKGRGTWAEGACTPEEFLVNGDKVVVTAHVLVRLKDKTEWLEGRVADGFAFRNGKIVQFNSYSKKQQALDWAGIKA